MTSADSPSGTFTRARLSNLRETLTNMLRFLRALLITALAARLQAQPAVSLHIDTDTGATEFHQSETIGIALAFETSAPGEWMVHIEGRDRSVLGLLSDRFVVAPEDGITDPMRDRLSRPITYSGPLGMMLREKPDVAHVDLNQWVRFDRPGYYRIHAVFHAFTPPRPGATQPPRDVIVESNDIGLTILAADPAWQSRQLQAALAVLNTVPDAPDNKSLEARTGAARQISYLDTPDSIRESARLLASSGLNVAYILKSGLLASAHRDQVAAAMKRLLAAPDQPVTPLFVQTLTELEAHPDLAAAIPQKRGAARAISMTTLLDGTPAESVPPETRAEIAGLFPDLPSDRQSDLLGPQWQKIAGPTMIPVLRHIYDAASLSPGPTPQTSQLAAAVTRLYELDPAQGRALLLDEMRRQAPRLPFDVLALLPDATLPGLDQLFAQHLEPNGGSEELIARYATPAILDHVKAFYAGRNPAHRCDASLIAYFLRADPPSGERILREALAGRGNPQNRCWFGLIGRTARYSASPAWEKVAIDALGDPAVAIKIDAVESLAQHGSPASEAPVWDAFRYWHAWWKDRRGEMNDENRRFEQVFLESIAHARNWDITPADFERIHDLCITQSCMAQADENRRERRQ